MIKADWYLKDTIEEIFSDGNMDKNPRATWSDGTPAHAYYITQNIFNYSIYSNEFPITTLRTTALKGAFYDIQAIYIHQTNIIEEMHPSIWSWWRDFIVEVNSNGHSSIGQTYGHTVKRYSLMDKLLEGMEKNPFGRRHMINLWQEQQMQEDPKALVPCAYMTNWSIREAEDVRMVDLTLHQRSQDFCMTSSINPAQYCMLGLMVCGHLTHVTGIKHELYNFLHIVENAHIYDRHIPAAKEILERTPIEGQPTIKLKENKNFYDYKWEDFEITLPEGIKPLTNKLEIAI